MRLIVPGDDGYDAARRIWNLDADRRPAVIACCTSGTDVRRALELARTDHLDLAVRGGGHSQAGFSVCDGGVVVDLAGLNAIDVHPGRDAVRVGAGARVGALIDALTPVGLVTPTGGCPDVGLGGLTLGGGESFLMGKLGTVSDSLLSAEIVTADGATITASADSHPDLFWALRGGGGNFGIATSFTLRTYPIDRVLAGRFMFPVSRTREVVRIYRDLIAEAPDEFQTSGGIVSRPVTTDGEAEVAVTLFIEVCHCGAANDANGLVDRWRASLRPDSDDVAWGPYAATLILPPIASSGTGAFVPELNDPVVDILSDYFLSAPPSCTAAWNDHHGAVTRIPVAATAFPLRQRGFDLFVHAGWKTPALRPGALEWLTGLSRQLQPFASGVYVNSLGNEPPDRTAEAYGPNYARLRTVKSIYDPGNVFRGNHNIPPA
ncbi:MAG TPA: FAD-binding oxidoreductase [Planctomycetaceae bacterium]|nr:FAD-binding oxidoreductase [Planctomycetaceae bacterium]